MMNRQKWFRLILIVFAIVLMYVSYDISRRTTFPGSRPQLKERIERTFLKSDTSAVERDKDSISAEQVDSKGSATGAQRDEE